MQTTSFIIICLLILIGLAYLLVELVLELKEQRRAKDASDNQSYNK